MKEQFRAQHISTLPDGRHLVRAVFELGDAVGGTIHVMPLGPVVGTRDGRDFQVSDPARVIAQSELPCLVDWEHESERANGSTRAAGWITSFSVERGQGTRRPGVYGVVQWTPEGLADIKARSYRFLSPVLMLDPEARDVLSIASVALTNRPALYLDGIDRDQFSSRSFTTSKGSSMTTQTLSSAVRRELHAKGLSDDEIARAQAYRAQHQADVDPDAPSTPRPRLPTQRSTHPAAMPASAAASDATIDRLLLHRGMSAADIAAARKYMADQRAAGER